jgi:hypothetical protein
MDATDAMGPPCPARAKRLLIPQYTVQRQRPIRLGAYSGRFHAELHHSARIHVSFLVFRKAFPRWFARFGANDRAGGPGRLPGRKRNVIDYDYAFVTTETEAEEILTEANAFSAFVEHWISLEHPPLAKKAAS